MYSAFGFSWFVVFLLINLNGHNCHYNKRKKISVAICTFAKPPYIGDVWFTHLPHEGKIRVTGSVAGLPPNEDLGVHVHQYGSLGNECMDAGPHFNPFKKNHGSLTSYIRHSGDFGNLHVDEKGDMKFSLNVSDKGLSKYNGFLGRALVIHSMKDDLGTKPDQGSKTTGNSGPRLACATIGHRNPNDK